MTRRDVIRRDMTRRRGPAAACVAGIVALVVAAGAAPARAQPACPDSLDGYPLDTSQAIVAESTGSPGHFQVFCGYGNPYEYDPERVQYRAIAGTYWSEAPQTESPAIKCGSWFDPDSLATPNDVTVGDGLIEWVVYYDTVDQHYFTDVETMVQVNYKVFDGFPLDTARRLAFDLFEEATAVAAPCPDGGLNPLGVAPAPGAGATGAGTEAETGTESGTARPDGTGDGAGTAAAPTSEKESSPWPTAILVGGGFVLAAAAAVGITRARAVQAKGSGRGSSHAPPPPPPVAPPPPPPPPEA